MPSLPSDTWCFPGSFGATLLLPRFERVCILDVRRTGHGARDTWSPREFRSVLPELFRQKLGRNDGSDYHHLPGLAPSLELFGERAAHRPRTVFRDRFRAEFDDRSLHLGRAFIEAGVAVRRLPILLCAEACIAEFDRSDLARQDERYCHRFTLTRALGDVMSAAHPDEVVEFHHLRW